MTPAELIHSVRRRRGLTQAQLAARAGTSQPVVSAYEHGRRDPSFTTLAKLVEAGGETLRIDAAVPMSDLPPARDAHEHARRLLDVLSLADAIPARRRSDVLHGPRMISGDLRVTRLTLAQRVVELHRALRRVPHAFGGAIALAYYAEPRATIDIDLNVFVGVDRYRQIAARLESLGVIAGEPSIVEVAERDGQVRVMWDETPIDLFFSYDPFHDAAARSRDDVPFADTTIPILSATHLIACKVVFNRQKDWVDIDAMLGAGAPINVAEVMRWVGRIAGDTDPRYERIAALLTRR